MGHAINTVRQILSLQHHTSQLGRAADSRREISKIATRGRRRSLSRVREAGKWPTAYAIANLRDVNAGAGIVEYLERIDATLAPYLGHFIVHGEELERMDGLG